METGYRKDLGLAPGTNLIHHYFGRIGLPDWVPKLQKLVSQLQPPLRDNHQHALCDCSEIGAAASCTADSHLSRACDTPLYLSRTSLLLVEMYSVEDRASLTHLLLYTYSGQCCKLPLLSFQVSCSMPMTGCGMQGYFPYGSMIGFERSKALQHPKEVYEKLAKTSDEQGVNPWIIERMWGMMFGGPDFEDVLTPAARKVNNTG